MTDHQSSTWQPSRRAVMLMGASAWAFGGPAASAEGYVWRNVKVGGGGFVPGVVFSRVEKGLAYLRSDMGGLYRWDAAASRWTPVQDAMAESSYQGVESVAPDPVDANVVYAAVGMYRRDAAAILRSSDRGATWRITPVSFRMGGNEDGRGLGERLAVDPNQPSTLYFASRHDGLQVSRDAGATWTKSASFPLSGRGVPPPSAPTNPGLSFVVFDGSSSARGEATRQIIVGCADPGDAGVWMTQDAGESWRRIEGCPRPELLPLKAEVDTRGVLFITYADSPGPNGATDGAVMRLDTRNGAWADISPEKGAGRPQGGYIGVSLDRGQPGALVVSTLNRWRPGDTVWRSTDDGRTWRNLRDDSVRDVSATPFLLWNKPQADFGWWIAGLAVDPFDSEFVAYTTGATIFATPRVSDPATPWRPWVDGVEQTAVLTLVSPPTGPHLISGFGDIGGFTHEDLDRSPPIAANPVFGNTNCIDYAGMAPQVLVRSGTSHDGGARWAWSENFGRSWTPLAPPIPAQAETIVVRGRVSHPYHDAPITVSADGQTMVVLMPSPLITRDGGRSWRQTEGLPPGLRPVADRRDARRFYALDFSAGRIWRSDDGCASFSSTPRRGLPEDLSSDRPNWREEPWPLAATPGRAGDLWLVSHTGLYRSVDGGVNWTRHLSALTVERLSFGRGRHESDEPCLYAIGAMGGVRAIWRSEDSARTWRRINDLHHEYGRRFRCISGDPKVFGRVYIGTDGRGIIYGDSSG